MGIGKVKHDILIRHIKIEGINKPLDRNKEQLAFNLIYDLIAFQLLNNCNFGNLGCEEYGAQNDAHDYSYSKVIGSHNHYNGSDHHNRIAYWRFFEIREGRPIEGSDTHHNHDSG
ncbi:hypothetical protein D3C81_1749940 [compost metagenome]